jgi:RNA polymerase sigma-70 factor (ECF subfamily)
MDILALAAAEAMDGKANDRPSRMDPAAFEPVMRLHERMVLVTALRLLGNLEDAKDASQEVFLRLFRHWEKREVGSNTAGWLYRVTVNVCHDMRRRGRGEAPMEDAALVVDRAADPQQNVTDAERRAVMRMSLRMLSEKERAAVVLRDLEGLSTAEAAAALGSTEATVRSQIAKARVKMKGFVESYFRRRT